MPSTTVLPSPSSSPFKFAVNSTIIQHLTSRQTYMSTGAGTGESNTGSELVSGRGGTESAGAGRRGMHSACGAYWNNERDGMWSFKYETKGAWFIRGCSGNFHKQIVTDICVACRNGCCYFCHLDRCLKSNVLFKIPCAGYGEYSSRSEASTLLILIFFLSKSWRKAQNRMSLWNGLTQPQVLSSGLTTLLYCEELGT